MRFDAVLFDFDGTLADTSAGIFESVLYALKKLGKPEPDIQTLRRFIGPSLLFGFREFTGLSESEANDAVALYRENYSKGGLYNLQFYDGITELVQTLQNHGIRTGLASAKPDVFIQRILEHYHVRHLFDAAQGATLEEKHSDKSGIIQSVLETFGIRDMQRVLMVGDKCYDIDGAKKVGAVSAGVLFGFGTREELEKAGADFIAEDVKALSSFIFDSCKA